MERRFGGKVDKQLHWGAPPLRWRLAANEVHCWAVWLDLPLASIEKLSLFLSADERERARRFRVDKARNEFVAARGMLRKLLFEYLKVPSQEIVFLYGANGKPMIAPWMSKGIQFNVSHSGKLALFAVTAKHKVGIDVERITSIPEAVDIANRLFSDEASERVKNEAHVSQEFFFRSWTRNEALLKCSGEGISDEAKTALHLSKALVCELEPADGYVGAVAVDSSTPMELKTWRWEEYAAAKMETKPGADRFGKM